MILTKIKTKKQNTNINNNITKKLRNKRFFFSFSYKRKFGKIPPSKTGVFFKKDFLLKQPRCRNKRKENKGLSNKKGQSLIEYLILVALMGVATIGIIRTLNQTIKSRFANAIYALQGRNQKAKTHNMKKEEYQRSDLSNFMTGSASTDKKSKRKK